MSELTPYQMTVLVLAGWLALATLLQLPVLVRAARDVTDWPVVVFRGSLFFLAAVVAMRYVFDISPWWIAVGWFVLDLAASVNTVWIWHRYRQGK